MSEEEIDLLIWEYIDGDITDERQKQLDLAKSKYPDVINKIKSAREVHESMQHLPLFRLDHQAVVTLKEAITHSHFRETKQVNWKQISVALSVSALGCIAAGMYLFFEKFGVFFQNSSNSLQPFDVNLTSIFDTAFQFDTTYIWMYSVLFLILPIQYLWSLILERNFENKLSNS